MNDAATVAVRAPERRLTFAFAKRHGVLVRRVVDRHAETVYRADTSPLSVAEVRRYFGVPLKLERVASDEFDALLRKTYEAGSSAAMQMVEGLDETTDLAHLAQELPEPSDLM